MNRDRLLQMLETLPTQVRQGEVTHPQAERGIEAAHQLVTRKCDLPADFFSEQTKRSTDTSLLPSTLPDHTRQQYEELLKIVRHPGTDQFTVSTGSRESILDSAATLLAEQLHPDLRPVPGPYERGGAVLSAALRRELHTR